MKIMEPTEEGTNQNETNHSAKSAPRQLTGEEAALYDRQIRLWGLGAQRKLASSSVLLAGDLTCLLTQEIAKNVVLAGISKLSFMTGGQSRAEVSSKQTFLGSDLEAIVQSLKEMNPLVDVSITDGPVGALAEYAIVCAIGLPRSQELDLSDKCRAGDVPFLTGRVAGPTGWLFLDLGKQHQFHERSSATETTGEDSVGLKSISYCSYREAVDSAWKREPLRAEHGWHFACALQEFEEAEKRLPGQQSEDAELLLKVYERLREEKMYVGHPKEKWDAITNSLITIGKSAHAIIPPVAAIVGGMWGREILKVVSGKDEPLNNFFFFNLQTSAGSVEQVGQGAK